MKWKTVPFSELYAIPSKNGLTKPQKERGQGAKMINMGELFAYGRLYDVPMRLVPITKKEQSFKVEVNDLLFARRSLVVEGAGKCSIVMEVSPMTIFESNSRALESRKSLSPFLLLLFLVTFFSYAKHRAAVCAIRHSFKFPCTVGSCLS